MLSSFYDTKNLKGDLTGGLVAGVVALPLALAFGVQSGLGAIAGLYGAIAVGVFAAIFGGTATQASGPTGPMTVVSAALVVKAIELTGSIEAAMPIIILTFLTGGIIQMLFGFINIAGYIKYFPYPVVSGFMSGVGLIIILLQIFPLFGMVSPKNTLKVLGDMPLLIEGFNWQALVLGALTVLIYYVFPKITKAIPSALVALIVVSIVAYFLPWQVPIIGDIPSGLPSLKLNGILDIDSSAYALVAEYALVLAVLGSIDSLLTSVIADNMTKTKHNSNRELIGQGIGNMVAAIFGGIPGAGATKGTVVNINSGGKTRLSGVLHGLFLAAVLLGLSGLAAHIPLAVLAGILIPIGFKIIDTKGLKHLLAVPRADAVVLIIVLLMTTFGSLIQAVGIGVILASLLFMKRASDLGEKGLEVGTLAGFDGEQPWKDEQALYETFKNQIYIKHLYGPLFFGFTSHFQETIKALSPEVKALIIRLDRVPYIDQSGLYALENAVLDLEKRNVKVVLTGLQEQPKDKLESIDIIPDLVSESETFETIEEAFVYLKNYFKL
ncbi:SulP family sulfate permease [Nonlabens dokdonensis]|uniref:Low affinity sulfate transporter n=2 Tax=Nonlabens dokdonensis TaxID=328515 RepID=L7WEN0_NONDD|nr:SulP family inorganic anion transporter [Nonlabens dokdonensis]AGC77308.1 low affinity sulfate transporter [Nonlabens dokdonensis DSW-6]PZX40839.1 SulP family sulfate permease [Nonlabens dokdonensis]